MLINGVDHVELIVGNSLQAAQFYRFVLGFSLCGYAGPETGVADRISYLIRQNDIHFVLTSPIRPDSEISAHLMKHGEGVRDIAINVDDATGAFHEAVKNGAAPVQEPQSFESKDGKLVVAKVGAFGQTIHSFVERSGSAAFLPFCKSVTGQAQQGAAQAQGVGLNSIDHFAVAVPEGETGSYAQQYRNVFGFDLVQEEYTSTEYSAMNTKVVRNPTRKVILVFVEPATGKRRSPISEFLTAYEGAGVHHIAINAGDIIHTVRSLREKGVDFAKTPGTYYEDLEERVGRIAASISDLQDLGVLVDRDESGYLMQIFCSHLQPRPTFFFEIIQRMGAEGFGSGNIKALFKALERAQLARGAA